MNQTILFVNLDTSQLMALKLFLKQCFLNEEKIASDFDEVLGNSQKAVSAQKAEIYLCQLLA